MLSKDVLQQIREGVKKIWRYNTSSSREVSELDRLKSQEAGVFILLLVSGVGLIWLMISQASGYWYSYGKAQEGFDTVDQELKSKDEICLNPVLRRVIRPNLINGNEYALEPNKCVFIGHLESDLYPDVSSSALSFFENKDTVLVSTNGQKIKLWAISGDNQDSKSVFARNSDVKNISTGFEGIQEKGRYTQQYISLIPISEGGIKLKPESSGQGLSFKEDTTGKFTAVAFAPDGKTIATAMNDGTIAVCNLWDEIDRKDRKDDVPDSKDEACSIIPKESSAQNLPTTTALAFNYNGGYLASGSDNGTVSLWIIHSNNGATLVPSNDIEQLEDTKKGSHRAITVLVFNPKRNILVAGTSASSSDENLGDNQGVLQVWKIENNKLLKLSDLIEVDDKSEETAAGQSFNEAEEKVVDIRSLDFSADGQFLAAGMAETDIHIPDPYKSHIFLWGINLKDGSLNKIQLSSPIEHKDWVNTVKFSPNGEILASGSDNGKIKLWDIRELYPKKWWAKNRNEPDSDSAKREIPELTAVEDLYRYYDDDYDDDYVLGSIRSMSFSPDGKTLASMSGDNTIKLWQLQ